MTKRQSQQLQSPENNLSVITSLGSKKTKILKLSMIRSKRLTVKIKAVPPTASQWERSHRKSVEGETVHSFLLNPLYFCPPLKTPGSTDAANQPERGSLPEHRHILTLKSGKKEQIKSKKGRGEKRDRDSILIYNEVYEEAERTRVSYTAILCFPVEKRA